MCVCFQKGRRHFPAHSASASSSGVQPAQLEISQREEEPVQGKQSKHQISKTVEISSKGRASPDFFRWKKTDLARSLAVLRHSRKVRQCQKFARRISHFSLAMTSSCEHCDYSYDSTTLCQSLKCFLKSNFLHFKHLKLFKQAYCLLRFPPQIGKQTSRVIAIIWFRS